MGSKGKQREETNTRYMGQGALGPALEYRETQALARRNTALFFWFKKGLGRAFTCCIFHGLKAAVCKCDWSASKESCLGR